ncbi:hypothetical protein SCOR_24650 [Sulfidibacter corallicola]|uniref:Uncharacterized protein n=1 Tax=Sulfidibacter corallicola TaxID=2818388 RepID=A0A8A4TTN9_SULCO|nr:hypothetical protein [Sulfidibacter corallicola]QTD52402.1 hypothetical protein J3U87_08005 [Sulfidibacter corallicola]
MRHQENHLNPTFATARRGAGLSVKVLPTLILLSMSLWALAAAPAYRANFERKPLEAKSLSALAFGPEGILFAGDSIAARVYAIDTEDRTPASNQDPVKQNTDVEGTIAALLGVPSNEVMIHDMAVNPISQNVYLSVSRGRAHWQSHFFVPNDVANATILLRMDKTGKFEEVKLDNVAHTSADIPNPIGTDAVHRWKKTKKRSDVISDLAFHENKLYVAGLSNEEFASSMRVLPFPFAGKSTSTSLEIFHGAHGKWETASPVRTFIPYSIDGKPHLLAAYLCTPLVSFPVSDLKDKEHVRGKTLAELGSGNNPLDMVAFVQDGKPKVLLSNSNRTLMIFDAGDIASMKDGITKEVPHKAGVPYKDRSGAGVLQMDVLNDKYIVMMQRGAGGNLNMYSYDKSWL